MNFKPNLRKCNITLLLGIVSGFLFSKAGEIGCECVYLSCSCGDVPVWKGFMPLIIAIVFMIVFYVGLSMIQKKAENLQ
jgi:hypothetical protein